MNIQSEILDTHQVKLIVETNADELEEAKRKVVQKAGKDFKIPGFRPGKAPYAVVARQIGEAELLNAAIEELVDIIYPRAVEQSEITPYGPGSLTNIVSATPPTFEFRIPLAPEVELGDYTSIRIPYLAPELTEDEVEASLKSILESRATVEPKTEPAESGDLVMISLVGIVQKDGQEQVDEVINEAYLPIELSQTENSDEWPFPGFSMMLLGVTEGEEKTFSHQFEETKSDDDLSGKLVQFSAKVLGVRKRTLPELSDEFVKSLGDYETVDEFRKELTEDVARKSLEEYNDQYQQDLINKIIEISSLKYPPEMVDDEIHTLIHQFEDRLKRQGMELDTYLKATSKNHDDLHNEFHPVAIERIQRGLVIIELANAENITVDQKEIESNVRAYVEAISAGLDKKQKKQMVSKEAINSMVNGAISDAIVSSTLARIKAIANEEEKESQSEVSDQTIVDSPEASNGEEPEIQESKE